MHMP